MNRTGFTLIELMIVVVIIGIIAAIAIPKCSNTKEKAYIASMQANLRNLATAAEGYFADYTAYTDITDCNTPPAPGSVAWCPSSGNAVDKIRIHPGGRTLLDGAKTMSRMPPRPTRATEASSSPRWAGTWNDITSMIAACAKLDHAANRMRLRCTDGFRAASNTKTPDVASTALSIGPA